jgi:hypothetical protein
MSNQNNITYIKTMKYYKLDNGKYSKYSPYERELKQQRDIECFVDAVEELISMLSETFKDAYDNVFSNDYENVHNDALIAFELLSEKWDEILNPLCYYTINDYKEFLSDSHINNLNNIINKNIWRNRRKISKESFYTGLEYNKKFKELRYELNRL